MITRRNSLVSLIAAAALFAAARAGADGPVPEGLLYETVGKTITVTKYTGSAASVDIPASIDGLPVTVIGNAAFFFCKELTSVVIPSSVTAIGEWAFHWSGLTSVTIPPSVVTIGDYAFNDCSNLTSVVIPSSVTDIGEAAFYATGLTSVTISRNTRVAAGAFGGSVRIQYRD